MFDIIEQYHDKLLFIPAGGANEIGMNLNLYCYKDTWIMVDCGSGFAGPELPGVDMLVVDIKSFFRKYRDKIAGIVLTHAHEDHAGAIQYLWDEVRCPIYATKFTANFLRRRLEEYKIGSQAEIRIIDDQKQKIAIGPFSIETAPLTHSAPEMQALLIRTAEGNIFHTGDWKFDHDPLIGLPSNEELLKQYGEQGVLALVCDSTNVFNPGRSGSEGDLRKSLVEIIAKCEQLVVVTTFASNLARLDTIIHAAQASGRKVVLAGRSVHRMVVTAQESGYLQDVEEFVDARDMNRWDRKKLLVIATGCQGEPLAAMSRMANGSHDVRLVQGDTIIFSSKIIPGNERKIYNLFNTFLRLGVEVITERDHFTHVSGHPSIEELKIMYDLIRPAIAVPVHGEPIHIHEHAKLARSWQVPHVLEVKNGSVVLLDRHHPRIITEIDSNYLAVDGHCLLPVSSPIFAARRKLMNSGVIVVTLVYNHSKLLCEPIIAYPGCLDHKNDHQLMLTINEKLKALLHDPRNQFYRNSAQFSEKLKRHLRDIMMKELGKSPMIIVNTKQVSRPSLK